MGQTPSDLSHPATTSGRAKWKAGETSWRLRIRRPGSGERRRGDGLNKNPMKNKVVLCLGRRKRDSSEAGADSGCGSGAGDPAVRRDHRGGKLPRDELVSTAAEQRASSGRLQAPRGLDESEAGQPAVKRGTAAGPSDAPGLGRRSGEVSVAGCEEPTHEREDNASDPPTKAMEDQPLGGNDQDCAGCDVRELAGASLSAERASSRFPSELDSGSSVKDEHAEGKMTKTGSCGVSCPLKAAGDCCSDETECRKDLDPGHPGPPGGQSYPGTIPKLIITRDPSPSRSPGAPPELCAGSCLDTPADDESPCSDSGCGGSPALMRSPRKLSNSSSIGLSSASSFEESEDDFTGSDIESSLSPARSLCSPDDGTGVSVSV